MEEPLQSRMGFCYVHPSPSPAVVRTRVCDEAEPPGCQELAKTQRRCIMAGGSQTFFAVAGEGR